MLGGTQTTNSFHVADIQLLMNHSAKNGKLSECHEEPDLKQLFVSQEFSGSHGLEIPGGPESALARNGREKFGRHSSD